MLLYASKETTYLGCFHRMEDTGVQYYRFRDDLVLFFIFPVRLVLTGLTDQILRSISCRVRNNERATIGYTADLLEL